MLIKDRFTRGVIAGMVAGIITKPYDLFAFFIGFSTLRWMDVAGILLYGKKPIHLGEQIFATLGTWFFHSLLGVIFIFMVQRLLSSNNLHLKGWFYGVFWWFSVYAITQLLKIPELAFVPLKTSLSNFIGASIWGLVLASAVNWLDNKVKQ